MSSFHFQIMPLKIHTLKFYPLCHNFDQFSGEWPIYTLKTFVGTLNPSYFSRRWAESLMSSAWAKCVWLAIKNSFGLFQLQFFCWSLWRCAAVFKGFLWDWLHRALKISIGPGTGLVLPSRFSQKAIFFSISVRTSLKGVIYPLVAKSTQQRTTSSSSKAMRNYSLVQLERSHFPLCRRVFITYICI